MNCWKFKSLTWYSQSGCKWRNMVLIPNTVSHNTHNTVLWKCFSLRLEPCYFLQHIHFCTGILGSFHYHSFIVSYNSISYYYFIILILFPLFYFIFELWRTGGGLAPISIDQGPALIPTRARNLWECSYPCFLFDSLLMILNQ